MYATDYDLYTKSTNVIGESLNGSCCLKTVKFV